MDYACPESSDSVTIYCANPYAQFKSSQNEIESAVLKVMRSNQYILGPEVENLEKEFAAYIQVNHAVGVANGTDAIEIALRSLDIGYGDEVITVSHTAVATVAAIEACGAIPVLVDIDEETFTLDFQKLQEVVSPKTKAVIAVHLYGQPADIENISKFCSDYNLKFIEDVSQAHGAKWKESRLGSFGDIAVYSCYPTKNLGAIGDGGLITTNCDDLNRRIRMIRQYGWEKRYLSDLVGRNSRLDEIQAAVLRIKLRNLDQANSRRREIAEFYTSALHGLPVQLPRVRPGAEHVFHLYVIRVKDRDALMAYLSKRGIECGIHYPMPIHKQDAYRSRIKLGKTLEITEKISDEVVSLPMYPELTIEDMTKVVEEIKNFFHKDLINAN
jgi:dTDP-4-amino-4,6-dideoxygalactose transaminase